jgi:outer membrane protein assembly factor BamB
VSIITPQAATPFPAGNVTTITTGFTTPTGILYDGANIWVTDFDAGKLFKLDAAGAILQTVTVGGGPEFPAFDGANIWVPSWTNSNITVVQASTGNVVATIATTATNLVGASFDGERVLVTNYNGDTLLVYKAADLSLIANISTGGANFPFAPCSDGINFWIPLAGAGQLLRF